MSRVVYTSTVSTPHQEALRAAHRVRLIEEVEEGVGVNALPGGVYGFTYSPALPNAPLFRTRRYRCYEMHKLEDDEVLIVGFTSQSDSHALAEIATDVDIRLQPAPEPGVEVLVTVPYSRIRQHRQYAVRSEHGVMLRILGA